MQTEMFKQFQAPQLALDSINNAQEINFRVWNSFTQFQLDVARLNIETGVEQVKILSNAQSYEDLYNIETDLADAYKGKFTDLTREWLATITSSQEEYRDLFTTTAADKSVKATSTPVNVTKKTTKKRSKKKTV